MYTKVKGNVWEHPNPFTPIAHCIAVDAEMASGFADQVRERYPYMTEMIRNQNPKIGDAIYVQTGDNKTIINLITKPYSRDSRPTQEDFRLALEALGKLPFREVIMPYIGTGLDKLSKKFVDEVLAEVAEKYDKNFTVYVQ